MRSARGRRLEKCRESQDKQVKKSAWLFTVDSNFVEVSATPVRVEAELS